MKPKADADPPYLQICAELRRRIRSGELGPGDRIPSTRQIAHEFHVAMATATKALAMLAQEGLVRAVPRMGTVVAEQGPRSTPVSSAAVRRRPGRAAVENELTRERIVKAAIEIADTEGLAALSMRGVAAELGVATMSLYRHVKDKEELVFAMIDAAFSEYPPPANPPTGWRARLELVARLQWEMFRRHPWLAQVVTLTRPQPLPNVLVYGEWVLASFDGLGLDIPTIFFLHVTIYSYVRGIAIDLETEAQAQAETGITDSEWVDAHAEVFRAIAAEKSLPTFNRLFTGLEGNFDFDLDKVFQFGLGPLLDGLGLLIEARRSEPPRRGDRAADTPAIARAEARRRQ
ncbi:MAG: GntR family transcriptional regulator [Polyangiaceae bacterium]|nr:GntR family transcriptional regulator [Polyangiaceae bacterium]